MSVVNFVDRIMGDPTPLTYTANAPVTAKFDRTSVLNYLDLRLTGTLTLASYSGAPTKYVEAVENLVQQILLTATGGGAGAVSDTLKAADFAWFHRHSQFLLGTQPKRTDVGTSNAAYAFESNCRLFLGSLDTRALSAFIMQIQWRDATAMVTGGTGGTATLSNVQITVQGREILGLPIQPSRKFLKESSLMYNVTASTLAQKLSDLPVGNVIKRMGFKGTVGAVNYADPSDTVFANTSRAEGPHVTIKANSSYTAFDQVYGQIQATNKQAFNIESWPAGFALWQPRVPFNAGAAARLDAFIDTNYTGGNTNEIWIYPVEVVSKS